MSRSKYFEIEPKDNLSVKAGVVDKLNIKSVFIKTSAYYTAITEEPLVDLKKFMVELRRSFARHIKGSIFNEKFLSYTDTPDTFEANGGGFINMEFTFFINDIYHIKYIEQVLIELIDKVYEDLYLFPTGIKIRKHQKEKLCQEQK